MCFITIQQGNRAMTYAQAKQITEEEIEAGNLDRGEQEIAIELLISLS